MRTEYILKGAAIINASGKYITIVLQLLVNAILSRLLSADDFGIVAVITVFSTFLSLSDMGFSAAIVQNRELTKDDTDKIFAFTIFITGILAGTLCITRFCDGAAAGRK